MVNFEFHIPTRILFGKNQIEHLSESLSPYGNRILLCYGKNSIKKIGLYDTVMKQLKEKHFFVQELSGIDPNPRIEDVKKGIDIVREHGLTAVLAIGGGSTIDCAKAIAAGFYYEGDPWDLIVGKASVERALPLICVVTIAATGSEMNGSAVISKMDTNQKLAIETSKIVPKVSILDPTYTYTVPKNQTAAGVADIISHTLENYFSLDDGAYLQNRFAEAILKTCIHYGPILLKEPNNAEARENIMWAASWAINGLLSAGKNTGWSVHAIEHELSAFYDITHGEGLAILTPHWLRHVCNDKTVDTIAQFAVNVWGCDSTKERYALAEEGISCLQKFFASLGLPQTLADVGIGEENLKQMAEQAVFHKGGKINGFQVLSADDVLAIYHRAK